MIFTNPWSAYTSPVSSNCPHEDPGHENSPAQDENSTLMN